jgi:hypothetical protein
MNGLLSEPTEQQCSSCGEVKAAGEFYANAFRQCRECKRASTRERRAADPEKARERGRTYSRKYRSTNPEKAREHGRKWRAANLEKRREYKRKYAAANPEKTREYRRNYRAANPEKTRESKHKDKYGPEHTQWYSRQFEAQRGRCAFCGRTEGEVATPKCPRLVTDHDHITGELRRLLCKDCNIAYGRFFEKSRAEGTYAGAVAQLNTLRNARHGLGGISHLRQVP